MRRRCLEDCKFYCNKACAKLGKKAKLGVFCNNYKKQNLIDRVIKYFFY